MSNYNYKILGIDPGFGRMGYGIIGITGSRVSCLNYGVIETDPSWELPERIVYIYNDIKKIIREFEPEESAIEKLFFFRNVTTAIHVSQATGVAILALQQAKIPIYEYTPYQIKQSVTGYGKAEKGQIQRTLKLFFNLEKTPKPDDASDALAAAWCRYTSRSTLGGEKVGNKFRIKKQGTE